MNIRRNDIVVATRGREKGKQGKVLQVNVEKRRVIVEGLQKVKPGAPVKPVPWKGPVGATLAAGPGAAAAAPEQAAAKQDDAANKAN